MWWISARDMQWRRRRFAIAVVGAGMVFALALLISGISSGFRVEARRTVDAIGGDGWVMRAGTAGPITSIATVPSGAADVLDRTPGVAGADPIVVVRSAVRGEQVLLVGHTPSGLGSPPVDRGRASVRRGEAVVDRRLGADIGDRISVGGTPAEVVGLVRGVTVQAGVPAVFVTIADARDIAFDGRELATAVLVEGRPDALPRGTHLLSPADVRDDALSPLRDAIEAIDIMRVLLWVVAAVIIGSIVYLSALERVRDFAVLKALGASSGSLITGLAIQSILVSVLAAVLSSGLTQLLLPVFPLPVEVSTTALLLLPAIAVAVGLVASLAGARRAIVADPSAAFS
ncbi:MAG: ABC transporter permease [Acidimicrobiales bacterium]